MEAHAASRPALARRSWPAAASWRRSARRRAAHAALRDAGDGARQRARRRLDGRGGDAVRTDAAGNLVGRRRGRRPGRRDPAARLAPRHRARRRAPSTARSACSPRWRASSACARRESRCPSRSTSWASATRRACATGPPTSAAAPWRGASSPRCSTSSTTTASTVRATRCAPSAARPAAVGGASRRGERLLGYCEVHIEQGPVLEGRGVPVGVVSAIAGATRAELDFAGRAGHAGTVPMDARHDAACAAAEWVLAVEAAARGRAGPGGDRRPAGGAPGRAERRPRRGGRLARRAPCRRRGARGRGRRRCAPTRSGSAPRAGSRWRGARS